MRESTFFADRIVNRDYALRDIPDYQCHDLADLMCGTRLGQTHGIMPVLYWPNGSPAIRTVHSPSVCGVAEKLREMGMN